MAVTKTIVKLNHLEALVKIVATTPGDIDIILRTDLLKSNEELSGELPVVNLGATETSVETGKEIIITRNGEFVCYFFENNDGFEMPWGADTHENTGNLKVHFTGKGTIYLRLLKLRGYRPKFRPAQGVN